MICAVGCCVMCNAVVRVARKRERQHYDVSVPQDLITIELVIACVDVPRNQAFVYFENFFYHRLVKRYSLKLCILIY